MAKFFRLVHNDCEIKILDNPIVRRFAILFTLTFLLVLPICLFEKKNTLFFHRFLKTDKAADDAKNTLQMENTKRLKSAEQYFGMLDQTKLHDMLNKPARGNRMIALTIVTVSRNRHAVDTYEPKYLTQVVWQFISQLHAAKAEGFQYDVQIAVCNVDRDPSSYDEAKSLARFVPTFDRFDKTHFSLVHPLEKEKQDYVFCLNRSLALDPAYVLLVEDDALPHDNFFPVLSKTLSQNVEKHWHRGEIVPRIENLAYVKFYHPERLLGFLSLDSERLPELAALVGIIGTALTGLYWLSFHRKNVHIPVYIIWTVCSIYVALVLISIGRSNIDQWRRLFTPTFHSYTKAPSCCTPAMLFPRDGATKVVEFLSAKTCENNFGKDSILDQMLQTLNMNAYLVQPNTFTHIGQYSAIREKLVDPFIVD